MTESGFHDGELAVQRRAGVHAQAARLGTSMLAIPALGGGIGEPPDRPSTKHSSMPEYIQQRDLVHTERREPVTERILRSETLGAEDIALIGGADTFFLGTVHPSRGPTHRIAAARRALCAWRAANCGGRITPATTCSTASATSR